MRAPKSPGSLIRSLRVARRLSQEELAHRAEISPRHLSCLETGRASPSHKMLLVLGSAMELPLRVRNTLLIAAGFAPAYEDLPLDDPAMGRLKQAIEHMLAHHEPNPAMVLDRFHNVLKLNSGARRLFAWTGVRFPTDAVPNAVRAAFDKSYGLRECIVGFDDFANEILARIRIEADVDPRRKCASKAISLWTPKQKPSTEAPDERPRRDWGLLALGAMTLFLARRLLDEEQFLVQDLRSYREYQQRVKHRLVPFVW